MERSYLCSEIRSHLPLYVGGELDPALQAAVERHLERCEGCLGEHAAAGDARRALMSLSVATGAGPDLWPAIRTRLASEGRLASSTYQETPAPAATRRHFTWRALPLSAAAALLLLASGVLLGRLSREGEAEGLVPAQPRARSLVQEPGPAPAVRPVALHPVDDSEWPTVAPEPESDTLDPYRPRSSGGQVAGFPVRPH